MYTVSRPRPMAVSWKTVSLLAHDLEAVLSHKPLKCDNVINASDMLLKFSKHVSLENRQKRRLHAYLAKVDSILKEKCDVDTCRKLDILNQFLCTEIGGK